MNLIEKAVEISARHHAGQTWKKTERPMIYHPLGVASLVFRHGGTETQAAAALLHDTELIPEGFPTEVAEILEGFTDPPFPEAAKNDWPYRRKLYLDKVRDLKDEVLFVILCEELHELSELVLDLKNSGTAVWKRYPVPDRDITWYFRQMTEIAYRRFTGKKEPLVQEMGRLTRSLSGFVHEGRDL